MTTFINQSIARQQVAEMVAQAETGRVRRQLRQARRAQRAARRHGDSGGPANHTLFAPNRIGLAWAR
jgi:hypothetical protein